MTGLLDCVITQLMKKSESCGHIGKRFKFLAALSWNTDIIEDNITLVICHFSFLLALQPPLGVVFYSPLAGFSLLACEVSWSHTTTRHSRWDSSERMISPSQRPLPDNTQHSQHTNIHAPGGIRTHNLSRRVAADLCLRPCGHWDRQYATTMSKSIQTG